MTAPVVARIRLYLEGPSAAAGQVHTAEAVFATRQQTLGQALGTLAADLAPAEGGAGCLSFGAVFEVPELEPLPAGAQAVGEWQVSRTHWGQYSAVSLTINSPLGGLARATNTLAEVCTGLQAEYGNRPVAYRPAGLAPSQRVASVAARR